MKKFIQITVIFTMTVLMMWCAGLLWFSTGAISPPQSTATQPAADAIIVLTGDKGRIDEGFYLFATKRAPRLFISGVHREVTIDILKSRWEGTPLPECCIDLGYAATNTWGNALESSAWFKAHNIQSIFLVTSNYHMPRARMEFYFAAPDVTVYPHPIYGETNERSKIDFAKLVIGEYHKTILTYLRNLFTHTKT